MEAQNFAPIKQRILQVIDLKQDIKAKIFALLEVSKSNFSGKGLFSEVGADVVSKFLNVYPDVNPEWLLTGRGSMLKDQGGHHNIVIGDGSAAGNNNQVGGESARIAFLEEQVKFYKEKIAFLEKQMKKK